MQQILQRHLFSLLQIDAGADRQLDLLTGFQLLLQQPMLQRHHGRHDLRNARHALCLMQVFPHQHPPIFSHHTIGFR